MSTRNVPDFWADIVFAGLFGVCIIVTGLYSMKAFKVNPQMFSLPNTLVMVFIQLTLISKSNRVSYRVIISEAGKFKLSNCQRRKLRIRHFQLRRTSLKLGDV